MEKEGDATLSDFNHGAQDKYESAKSAKSIKKEKNIKKTERDLTLPELAA